MKMIITIIIRLTLSCLVAGTIMGMTFVFTNKAKKANEFAREERVVYSLLGFSADNPIPESMGLYEVFRYLVIEAGQQSIGYLVPVGGHGEGGGFSFVRISLDGAFVDKTDVDITHEKVRERGDRDAAVQAAMGSDRQARFVDQTVIVTDHGKRTAYLLSGKFPGFKTNIAVMMALDPAYSMIGLEIMEHEEDPGLGAEIEQDYFKNQFKYKPFDKLKTIDVVKEPMPADYVEALEGGIDETAAADLMKQYKDKDIYALTGATISSKAVSSGVKGMVKKFAYRLDILDQVLEQQHIGVPF